MDKIIWQPTNLCIEGHDLKIILDREFANLMVSAKADQTKLQRFNEMLGDLIGRKSFNPHIQYYEDTALATTFSLGTGGIWLAVDDTNGRNPLEVYRNEPLSYSSHNVDSTSDRDILLRIVNKYIEYADILRE